MWDWWRAGERPLSVRGHVYGMVFWLAFLGIAVYRTLATDRELWLSILFPVGVLANLSYLLLSYRNALLRQRQLSPDNDFKG